MVAKDALDERVWNPSVEATPPLTKEGDVTNPDVGVDDENMGLPYPAPLGCPLSIRGCRIQCYYKQLSHTNTLTYYCMASNFRR